MTRHWWSHNSGHLAVAECMRVIKSVADILKIVHAVADVEEAITLVQGHIRCIESALSSMSAELSIPFHASLIFIRALDQLRIAASCSSTLKDQDKNCFSRDSDVATIIIAINNNSSGKLKFMCNLVLKGRNYMFHGTDAHRTFSLLQCTCAVAQLLRFVYKDAPQVPSPRTNVSDTASSSKSSPGTLTPKTPNAPSLRSASSFTCEPADMCEASAIELINRMGICDAGLLLQDIVNSHSDM